jgi:hypothetical protein
MRVFGIERHGTLEGMALRSHECPHCESLQTDIIPFAQLNRNDSGDPVTPPASLSLREGYA